MASPKSPSLWASLLLLTLPASAQSPKQRLELPIGDPVYPRISQPDVRQVKAPARSEVKAPGRAPNVVIVLLDDFGFGLSDTFGGGVKMPTLGKLADGGLRYNNFHTTALCSPTRMALKTGRNHHACNTGAVMEMATSYPGNTGQLPNRVASLAQILKLNGYSTAAFGKWHETPTWELSASGPYDRWPTQQGFEHFYGFMGGETNQWAPLVYDGTHKVEVPRRKDYHFTVDMTDRAIDWIKLQQAMTPSKPFFVYFAPGATHAPHHCPKEWADRYRGQFDEGWDRYREQTLQRQIQLGVVPKGTRLAAKPEGIKPLDQLSAEERKLYARQMEVFAGFASHTDHEVGRLMGAIQGMSKLDNTLFIYIAGDNGCSAEGGMQGLYNEMTYFNKVEEPIPAKLKHLEDWGDPTTYPHMAAGWAVAGDTPFQWTKQVPSSFGGTRNGMVFHWPTGIPRKGEIRNQFHHVVDIAPTVLEAAGLPQPKKVNGVEQRPMDGVSMLYSIRDAQAPTRHRTQYFEILGNRAVYSDGWLAGTVHRAPWEYAPRAALKDDRWELYHVAEDFSCSQDLAQQRPDKLKEMQALFASQATANQVFPLDDRTLERFDAAAVGRPDLMRGRNSVTLPGSAAGIPENCFLNIKNRSHRITARVTVPQSQAEGVLIAQGGRFGGWSLYCKQGKPAYQYNFLGLDRYIVRSGEMLKPGEHLIEVDFAFDGKPGGGGTASLLVDGKTVASGRVDKTQAVMFSTDETLDVGCDDATNVSDEFENCDNHFSGRIEDVRVDLR